MLAFSCLPSAKLAPCVLPVLQTLVLDEADLLLSYGYEADLQLLAPLVSTRMIRKGLATPQQVNFKALSCSIKLGGWAAKQGLAPKLCIVRRRAAGGVSARAGGAPSTIRFFFVVSLLVLWCWVQRSNWDNTWNALSSVLSVSVLFECHDMFTSS